MNRLFFVEWAIFLRGMCLITYPVKANGLNKFINFVKNIYNPLTKGSKMKKGIIISLSAVAFAIWLCVFSKDGIFSLQAAFIAAFMTGLTVMILYVLWSVFDNSYESKRKTVEWIIEQREKKQKEILFKMQYAISFPDALREIDSLIKKNPHLKLQRYIPFRAWYKHYQGDCLKNPEFYAKLLEAGMTPLDEDPYYFPNAPEWKQFDRDHTFDYDDDDYSDDFDEDETTRKRLKKAAKEGLYMGIGFGLASDILDDSSHSGGE